MGEGEKELERIAIACWSHGPVGLPNFLGIMDNIRKVGQRLE